jgi:putative NADH-flavin reductase
MHQSNSFVSALVAGIFLCAHVTAFSMQMKTNVVAGATGYIGKSVVRESVRQGHKTVALVRDKSKVESKEGKLLYGQFFEGAEIVECDVCDVDSLTKVGGYRAESLNVNGRSKEILTHPLILGFG